MKGFIQASLIALAVLSAPAYAGDKEAKHEAKATMSKMAEKLAVININTADVNQLQLLKGIGASKALAILEHRKKNGNFKSFDDLLKVKGIGSKFVAKNKSTIAF